MFFSSTNHHTAIASFLSALVVSSSLVGSATATDACKSAVDIACSLDDFSTLCTAIHAAGLGDALSAPGSSWTVFAPNNDAFMKLGQEMLDDALADKTMLTDILLFHAVPDKVSSEELECTATVEMANGQNSRTVCKGGMMRRYFQKGGSNPSNDMPEIIQMNIPTCQGYIHVVDEVMLPGRIQMMAPVMPPPPPECQSIAEIACGMSEFSTLCSAVTLAGLGDALSGGMWTVFAPTNQAFDELDPSLLNTVLADKALLTNVLLFHAVDHVLYAEDLGCSHLLTMANGADSRTVCRHGEGESGMIMYQKGAGNPRTDMPMIISADIGACNGVIHVIDEVMLP